MANLKLLCVSLFVFVALASSVFESTSNSPQVAFLQLADMLR